MPEICQRCRKARDTTHPSSLAWGRERMPDGRVFWLCPDCARQHLRDIEAKLPFEWW
jgi:hypothetical protein